LQRANMKIKDYQTGRRGQEKRSTDRDR
jgi:hypothetical protein